MSEGSYLSLYHVNPIANKVLSMFPYYMGINIGHTIDNYLKAKVRVRARLCMWVSLFRLGLCFALY